MALVYGTFKGDGAEIDAQQRRERNRDEADKMLYERARGPRISDCMQRARWRTATYGEPLLLPRPIRIWTQMAKNRAASRRRRDNEAAHVLLAIAVPRSGGAN